MMKAVLNKRLPSHSGQSGVGLIEVLIALVIFALGVVGMAALQLRTMSVTMDSTQRSYVVAKSQDVADRIRSNGIDVSKYLKTYNDDGEFCSTEVTAECADEAGADTAGCNDDQMVEFDLYDAFCVSDETTDESDGSYNKQVAEWQVVISCEYPLAGVMTNTTSCDEFGARVNIETTWFARSLDTDTSAADPARDAMKLSFVP